MTLLEKEMALTIPLEKLNSFETPFYFYDTALLQDTLDICKKEADRYGYHVHYALKANTSDYLLKIIRDKGLGADCVSGNEVRKAVETGFDKKDIVFAGVGKSDKEIRYALSQDIFSFNCEGLQELEVLNDLAGSMQTKARIALRINPNVSANTHHYITTGLEENKFGINPWEFDQVLSLLKRLPNVELTGLHFHIGSQINDLEAFKNLCIRVNEFSRWFEDRQYILPHLNVGGGLGVNYQHPHSEPIPDFASYFKVFSTFLEPKPHQKIHFELGRSLIAQCGVLISKVLFIKTGIQKNFCILDAGMTELIRPALYQAYHKIENLSSLSESKLKYDVVGPVCESSDCFGKAITLPETKRGDLIGIYTAGAYGEVMSSYYNLRDKAKAIYSDQL